METPQQELESAIRDLFDAMAEHLIVAIQTHDNHQVDAAFNRVGQETIKMRKRAKELVR